MRAQNMLFAETGFDAPALQPPGFRYQAEVITSEEEVALAASLGQLDLKPFEFHGHLGNRRVVSFGLKYDYSRRAVDEAAAMPSFLEALLPRVASFAGRDPDEFRQVGINEYRPGAGIGWHKDKPEFGIIVGISLLAAANMRFRRAEGRGWQRVAHIVQPWSIYMMDGEARTQWEHSIPQMEALRYSITFRTLSERFRQAE